MIIEKPQAKPDDDYKARLYALAKRGLISNGMTTEEFMRETRGDPAEDPPLRKR